MGVSLIIFLIMPCVWLTQHLGGTIIRSFIDIDTCAMVPEDPTGNKCVRAMCVTIGP